MTLAEWNRPFTPISRTTCLPFCWTLAPIISGLQWDISVELGFQIQFKAAPLPTTFPPPKSPNNFLGCTISEYSDKKNLFSILEFCYCAHLDVSQPAWDENLGSYLLLNGLLVDTGWLLWANKLQWDCKQAITKLYHVTWKGFSDESMNCWSICICLNNCPQAVLFIYFPPAHLVNGVCWAGSSGKRPRSLICRLEIIKLWKKNTKLLNSFLCFLLSLWRAGSQTTHSSALPPKALSPLLPPFASTTTTDHNVVLSFCSRDQWRALSQDFQS